MDLCAGCSFALRRTARVTGERPFAVGRVRRTALTVIVLPITLSVPWGLTAGAPPYLSLPTRVFIDGLEPIYFERSGPEAADDMDYVEACHRRVLDTMQLALDRLMRERRSIWRERLRKGLYGVARVFPR